MFPHPMSRSEFRADDSHLDLTGALEQYLLAGFPPDLALDLVLNELVVRAAQATGASAAALALIRGEEMVCRAATGHLAPDLGVPLNTRDGLSGACLQTRQPQMSAETEFDPRVDPAIPQRLGIRSILIVPVFDSVFGSNDRMPRSAESSKPFRPLPPPSRTPTRNCWKVSPRSALAFAAPPPNSVSARPPRSLRRRSSCQISLCRSPFRPSSARLPVHCPCTVLPTKPGPWSSEL